MKKLLVLAALSAMGAMSAKADYWTVNIPGAQAVYITDAKGTTTGDIGGKDYWNDRWVTKSYNRVILLDEASFKATDATTWAEHYDAIDNMLQEAGLKFEKVSDDGAFRMEVDSKTGYDYDYNEALIVAVMDSDKFAPGASFDVYYGIAPYAGGAFNIDSTPLERGALQTDSPTPAPEPTSGLLLLLGVAGLALKRKRA